MDLRELERSRATWIGPTLAKQRIIGHDRTRRSRPGLVERMGTTIRGCRTDGWSSDMQHSEMFLAIKLDFIKQIKYQQ